MTAIGQISNIESYFGDYRLTIQTGELPLEGIVPGDSIAANGVALIATELGDDYFCADVSREILAKTTFNAAQVGFPVNLEPALTLASRLGGHIVSGHVDGIATVVERQENENTVVFRFKAPGELARYITEKGSICVNGISLRVNAVNGAEFEVRILAHVLIQTTLNNFGLGNFVNIEVDLLARYVERLLQDKIAEIGEKSSINDLLQKNGFMVE